MPFLVNVPILYLLKTAQNQRFSGALIGYKMEPLARKPIFEKDPLL